MTNIGVSKLRNHASIAKYNGITHIRNAVRVYFGNGLDHRGIKETETIHIIAGTNSPKVEKAVVKYSLAESSG
jgi:hypothetical protein